MDNLRWFHVAGLLLLLIILAVLWVIKESLKEKKESDPWMIKNTRRFRKFEQRDYFFRKTQRKINQAIIKRLKNTYNEYENIEVLKEELLGIKVNMKEISDDFSLIFTAILSLVVSLIPSFGEMPLVITLVPSIFIIAAITSYLKELFEKLRLEESEIMFYWRLIPVIFVITTIMIMVLMVGKGSTPLDFYLTDWLFRLIIIEGIVLYLIQLFQKIKDLNYLEIVSIVLEDIIITQEREKWLGQK